MTSCFVHRLAYWAIPFAGRSRGIRDTIDAAAAALDAELRCLGTSVPSDRGALMHEVLISCGRFEKDFGKVLDGGRGGKFL